MSVSTTTSQGNTVDVSVSGGNTVSLTQSSTSISVSTPATSNIVVTEKGPKGLTGATGATGATGTTGAAGAAGPTYSVSCVDGDSSDEEKIRLTGSDSSTDDVVLEAGTGLSIARNSDKITFTNTVSDTNTTYTAGDGLNLSGTEFSADLKSDGGLVIESAKLAVDLSASSITGTLATGDGGTGSTSTTYCALGSNVSGTLPVGNGGTGATSLADNSILTGTGTSAITAEANLTFSSNVLAIGADADIEPKITLTNDENSVEIGIANAADDMVDLSTDGDLVINSVGNHNIIFANNDTQRLTIESGGSTKLGRANINSGVNFGTIQRSNGGAGKALNISGGNPKTGETDTNGGDLTFEGGKGTGTGTGGDVEIRTYPPSASTGTSFNLSAEIWKFTDNGVFQTPGVIELGSSNDTTIARASAGKVTIEDNQIVTAGAVSVASEAQAPIGIQIARRTITTAEANAMNSTPIEIVPAQGANTIIEVMNVTARADRAATQTNNSLTMDLHYADKEPGTYGSASLAHFRSFMYNKTTDIVERRVISQTVSGVTLTEDVNKAVEVSFSAAATTDCFTSLDMYVTYFVIDIS